MSMPTYPSVPDMTRESVINQIIASIAMEELSLSHILNAEGEKLQYVLGTLAGSSGLQPTVDELLKVNESVHGTLSAAMQNQMFLHNKMSDAIAASTASTSQGPKGEDGKTPTIGPNGNWFIGGVDTNVSASGGFTPAYIHLRNLYQSGATLVSGGNIIYDVLDGMSGGTSFTYDMNTGTVELYIPGVYVLSGVVKFDLQQTAIVNGGAIYALPMDEIKINIHISEGIDIYNSAQVDAAQVVLNTIFKVEAYNGEPAKLNLTNGTAYPFVFANSNIVSELSIYRIS